MAVSLTPALSQRERETKERATRDFHGKPGGVRLGLHASVMLEAMASARQGTRSPSSPINRFPCKIATTSTRFGSIL